MARLSVAAMTLVPVEALDVARVEGGGHRLDLPQRRRRRARGAVRTRAHRLGWRRRRRRRGTGPRHRRRCLRARPAGTKSLDQGHPLVGALAQADRAHLGERADRLGQALLAQLDTGDERARHGAEPDTENAQLAVGRSDGRRCSHPETLRPREDLTLPAGGLRPRDEVACLPRLPGAHDLVDGVDERPGRRLDDVGRDPATGDAEPSATRSAVLTSASASTPPVTDVTV